MPSRTSRSPTSRSKAASKGGALPVSKNMKSAKSSKSQAGSQMSKKAGGGSQASRAGGSQTSKAGGNSQASRAGGQSSVAASTRIAAPKGKAKRIRTKRSKTQRILIIGGAVLALILVAVVIAVVVVVLVKPKVVPTPERDRVPPSRVTADNLLTKECQLKAPVASASESRCWYSKKRFLIECIQPLVCSNVIFRAEIEATTNVENGVTSYNLKFYPPNEANTFTLNYTQISVVGLPCTTPLGNKYGLCSKEMICEYDFPNEPNKTALVETQKKALLDEDVSKAGQFEVQIVEKEDNKKFLCIDLPKTNNLFTDEILDYSILYKCLDDESKARPNPIDYLYCTNPYPGELVDKSVRNKCWNMNAPADQPLKWNNIPLQISPLDCASRFERYDTNHMPKEPNCSSAAVGRAENEKCMFQKDAFNSRTDDFYPCCLSHDFSQVDPPRSEDLATPGRCIFGQCLPRNRIKLDP